MEGDFDVSLEELPRTFRDAITVTRRLNFNYLWIDSLCIIQGDEVDWNKESANMATIYANGVLNLPASYSTDSDGGLMLERNHLQVRPCQWKHQREPIFPRHTDGTPFEAQSARWIFDPQVKFKTLGTGNVLPLYSRGWVLQEIALSPRTLHFLPGEVIWECRDIAASESSFYENGRSVEPLRGFSGMVGRSAIPVIPHALKHFFLSLSSIWRLGGKEQCTMRTPDSGDTLDTKTQQYQLWYEIVTYYSQMALTEPRDRLPAIWALAKHFQQVTGDEYCSGLWKDDILAGLLFTSFKARSPTTRTSQGINIPSWAAAESKVKFESESPHWLPRFRPDARVEDIVLVPLDSSGLSMGRTRKGEIRIRTYTRHIVGNRSPSPEQRAAKVLGFPPTVILKYDVIQLYSDLEREYECRTKCPTSNLQPC